MRPAGDHVGAFGLAVHRDPDPCAVAAVAHTRGYPDPVHLVSSGGHGDLAGVGATIAGPGASVRPHEEVVVPRRLVVDPRDRTGAAVAERVLVTGIGVAAGGEQSDVVCD